MKLSANLGLLWSELPLLERVYKAKEKNFDAVEFQFPYEVDANELKKTIDKINLTVIAKGPNRFSSSFPMEIDDSRANKALVDFKVGSVLNTINNTAQKPNVWFKNISKIMEF